MRLYNNPTRQEWPEIVARPTAQRSSVKERVSAIIEREKRDGDRALRELSAEIDSCALESLEVSATEIQSAQSTIDETLKSAIELAAKNITTFHKAQLPTSVDIETMEGVRCIQCSRAIERVGLYIPGGSAPLFSTVLMLALPAKIAGCKEVILCTPPNSEGEIAPAILYAAALCGVDKIYRVGGAQAIAAMAYGTDSITRVDKIFGPGNQYVTEAKQQLSTSVAIDMPAGPSEVLVLADKSANAEYVAADLLSQAEHGADSQVLLACLSEEFARRVEIAIKQQLSTLEREQTARAALENSRIAVLTSRDQMVEFANLYAAEHLIISMQEPWSIAERITAAGSIFIGNYSPESAGDYASGTNHTLPTYGWARSHSGVNIDSFTRKITIQEITPEGLLALGPAIETMASAEGLAAHRNAVSIRLKDIKGTSNSSPKYFSVTKHPFLLLQK